MSIDLEARIVARTELVRIRRELRDAGRSVVFTNGCFDLLHRAHVEYLREARSFGDLLMVGVNDDAGVRALKGPRRPLMPAADRAVMLAELRSVDYVCVFAGVSVEGLVAELLPDVLVKGGDYRPEDVVGRRAVQVAGGIVRCAALWPGTSTSDLLSRIRGVSS